MKDTLNITREVPHPAPTARSILKALDERVFSRDVLRGALLLKGGDQAKLFALARARREAFFPSRQVEVRSVIEISNICHQGCQYCNMGKGHRLRRYLIGFDEFVQLAGYLYGKGRRVLLVQSGENRSQNFVDHVCKCVREIKRRYPDLVLILCLGNMSPAHYRQIKQAGAERYIIKFETSNSILYSRLKPNDTLEQRTACIRALEELGFQIGTGNIVGLPGQTMDDVVDDLYFAGQFKLAMVSCTAFIPGEDSILSREPMGDGDLALNTMALLRIMYSDKLVPTTSALERAKEDGQYLGLMAGANTVTIHDGTPLEFKELFPIYSTMRFAPKNDHIATIVRRAKLKPAPGALK